MKINKFKDNDKLKSNELKEVIFITRKNFENDLNLISGTSMGYTGKSPLCYKESGINNLIFE